MPRDLKRVMSRALVRPAMVPASTSPISPTMCARPIAPSWIGSSRSPDSRNAPARESTYTRARRTASVSSSRQSGRGAPTALICAPSASHAPRRTGADADVAVTIISAPRTASSADAHAVMGALAWGCMSVRNRWTRLGVRDHTRTCRSGRAARMASRWLRAWTPAPSTARIPASFRASARVAAADVAAVRISVISRPSIMDSNSPVALSHKSTTARCVGRSRAALRG